MLGEEDGERREEDRAEDGGPVVAGLDLGEGGGGVVRRQRR
ncbi:hypothetical protein [Glycomyces terrestris]|nr:hypothetical protein [Glycomyces terrestris]